MDFLNQIYGENTFSPIITPVYTGSSSEIRNAFYQRFPGIPVSLSQSAPFTKTDRNFVKGVDSAFFRKADRRTHKSARQSATTSATVTGGTFPTVIAAKISEAVSGSDETS